MSGPPTDVPFGTITVSADPIASGSVGYTPAMMELEAIAISAAYGAETVVTQVSVAVRQGELVGLIGPNGCGKSTLLRCLSRILPVRTGSVRLDGRDISAWSARSIAQRLGFVPQQESALFEFTVQDVVLMGRHPHIERWKAETDTDYRIVMQALADADILHLADRAVTQLSGGEYRRVLLARALAQQTPILLLDEPTSHLDVTHQVELLSLIKRQTREKNQGSIAALHDLNQAAEFCDRLILMCRGRTIAEGAPEAVLTPANLRTAYSADVQVGCNPATGRTMLLSVHPAREAASSPAAHRIHVVSGGGTGVGAMGSLVRAGFHVSAGVLNLLDTDCTAAEALGIETAQEAPFSRIGPESRAKCAELMAAAETILITPVPIGKGNLANLELALEAQTNGSEIVILGDGDPAFRDYADGDGAELFRRLLQGGGISMPCVEDWIAMRQSG